MPDRLNLDEEFPGNSWLEPFRNEEGKIGGREATLFDILQACPQTAGAIAYNTRRWQPEALRKGPWGDPGPWTDTMTAALVIYFQGLGIPAGVKRLETALTVFTDHNRIDPLLDYLNGLRWDGVERVDTWLWRYAGAAGDKIVCDMGAMFLIGMMARAIEPGCQVDHALCLEGEQGVGKSQIARTLGGEYFAGDLPDFHSRDAQRIAGSHWVIEIGELAAVRRSDLEHCKTFITAPKDTYTEKWRVHTVTRPRWCVFIFTVNPDGSGYLVDNTGNRRIWPVKVGQVDITALRRDRDQLFAEALHRYRFGEKWWPTEKLQWDGLGEEQIARTVEDPWWFAIMEWLERGNGERELTTSEILTHALDLKPKEIDRFSAIRVGKILKERGWTRHQQRLEPDEGGGRRWFYRPPVTRKHR